jgi:uncharacterized protein YgiM (DUF1202 family)
MRMTNAGKSDAPKRYWDRNLGNFCRTRKSCFTSAIELVILLATSKQDARPLSETKHMEVRMSAARRLFLAAAVSVSALVAAPVVSYAQDVAPPEIENAKYNFQGVINSPAVNVRSGPGDNYYPTSKIEKGQTVTVVGIRFDWLKIKPPADSYSYVAKAYITRSGDGTTGTVDKPDLRVRAGSTLNEMKTTVQTTLQQGDKVTILGEKDEYYKVAPPANVYLYVNKSYVDPVKTVEPAPEQIVKLGPATKPADNNVSQTPDHLAKATTKPADIIDRQPEVVVAEVPTTKPAIDASQVAFEKLETDFIEMSKLPIDQQAMEPMIKGYEALTTSDLPESLKRTVDIRLATMKLRSQSKDEFLALKKSQEDAAQRQVALRAEQQELEERIKTNQVKMYTAIGTLRTSSLQQGGSTLYRLTDPSTGRTTVYIRSADPKFGAHLGKFIGVSGDLVTDQQLNIRVVSPTASEVVDMTKVGKGVAAQVIPPSLLPQSVSSSAK